MSHKSSNAAKSGEGVVTLLTRVSPLPDAGSTNIALHTQAS